MSLLLSLVLAVPAQVMPAQAPLTTADPLSYLPEDSLVLLQIDPEPWKRLGPATPAHALLQHEGIQGVLAQLECPEWSWELFANYSITAGIGLSDLLAGRVLLVLEGVAGAPQLDPAAFGESSLEAQIGGLTVRGAEGAFAWCLDGDRTLVLLRYPGLGPRPGFDDDVDWLATRVKASHAQAGNAAAIPSVAGMRSVVESEQDLFRLYLPLEQWTFANLGRLAGFDPAVIPFDFGELLVPFGLDKVEGVCWTTSIDGARFLDLILVFGEEPMAPISTGCYAEDDQPVARLAALPGDATMASLSRFDMKGMVLAMGEMFDSIFSSFGEDWRDNSMAGWVDAAAKIAGTMGNEIVGVQRAEDLWERRNGAIWFELEDPAAFQAALAELPPEVLALLKQGMDGGPGSYRLGLTVEGSRAYLARSLAEEEADGTLGESKAFRQLRPWLAERVAAGRVSGLGYIGPEVSAEGFDSLRRDGLPAEFLRLLPGELDLSGLPDFDFVAARIGGTATVARAIPEGLLMETVSPFGYLGAILVNPALADAILQGMSGQSPFGNAFGAGAYGEEF